MAPQKGAIFSSGSKYSIEIGGCMSLTTFEVIEPISKEVIPTVRVDYRTWHAEPDGPNDREIDIWYRGSWVPAYFSDIQNGDFFLDVKMGEIAAGKCFLAKSKLYRSVSPITGKASFVVQGIEVVQAPAIKDINTIALSSTKVLELK